jgi:hypothetical protein
MTSTVVDFEAIKDKQRSGWQTGDYPRVGNTLQIIAELLVEAADVRAGQRALDVPLPDQSFDLTLSTVGVMFAPDHGRA